MLTTEEIKEILDYNQGTGVFTWKVGISNKKKGSTAGCMNDEGYICISIRRKDYKAHRLAWLLVYGYFPENGIDHLNRNRSDNRIVNLRETSQSCNIRNSGLRCTNRSGIKGVSWREKDKRWRAQIKVNGKQLQLCLSYNKTEAVVARYNAEKKYNFLDCDNNSTSKEYLLSVGAEL